MSGYGFGSLRKIQRTKTKGRIIDLYYQNVRGLRTKLVEFRNGLSQLNSDLFAITESGCNQSIEDCEIIPNGYQILRCDRTDGRKQGGALLIASRRYELRRVNIPFVLIDNCVFEMLCATVFLNNHFLFFCCVVYIPPNSSEDDYLTMFRIIEEFCTKYKQIIVVGDFNMYSCPLNINNYFEYFMSFCEFSQCNTVINSLGRQLDLVLSAGSGATVSVEEANEPLVLVDPHHPPLEVRVRLFPATPVLDVASPLHYSTAEPPQSFNDNNLNENCQLRPKWNFYKADYQLLYSRFTSVDWQVLYEMHDVDKMINYFYTIINYI